MRVLADKWNIQDALDEDKDCPVFHNMEYRCSRIVSRGRAFVFATASFLSSKGYLQVSGIV